MSLSFETATWTVNHEKVEAAVRRIVEIGMPRKIILFGSYARDATDINSDVDILVIVPPSVKNSRQEGVRLRRGLRDISMPMDIIVVPEDVWEARKETPGTVYREALLKGKVVYEA